MLLTRELFQTGIFILPCICIAVCLDISSPRFSRAGIPSLTQNSEAMSWSVGLVAEVGTGHIRIIAIPSNIILSTSLTKRFVTHSGQDEPMKSFYNPVTRNKVKTMSDAKTTVWCKTKDIPMNGEEMYLRL